MYLRISASALRSTPLATSPASKRGVTRAEPRVDVQALDLLVLLGQREHVLRRLDLARRGRRAALVGLLGPERAELVEAAGLGQPVLLAAERLHDRRGAGRAEAVDVGVVVDAADVALDLQRLAEGLDPLRRLGELRVLGRGIVGLVEDVGDDDLAVLAQLRDGVGELRRRRGAARRRLREVVGLVPGRDDLDASGTRRRTPSSRSRRPSADGSLQMPLPKFFFWPQREESPRVCWIETSGSTPAAWARAR